MTSTPSPQGALPSSAGADALCLRLGSWNVSHWTPAKAAIIAQDIGADILAVQETHLATLPLEWAHGTCRNLGLHLQHGHPVSPLANRVDGRSCGVGFVTRQGVALSPAPPIGAAWRRLYAMSRLSAVRLPPRPGLPHGLLLLSVYAPLQIRAHVVAREQFVSLVLEVTHSLDMQTPTLLLGDFNGSADPQLDFLSDSGKRRPVCPLLSTLLGPGGAWVDVHRAHLGDTVPWTFRSLDTDGTLSASRIDLVLANHSAMALVAAASVLDSVYDGGHCPILVDICLSGPVSLDWFPPRPRLPPLLQLGSSELRQSADWQQLVDQWMVSPCVTALAPSTPHTGPSLSAAMVAALQHLVALAGGWVCKSASRRSAYDSPQLRNARRMWSLLNRLSAQLHTASEGPPGCWPRPWLVLLDRLALVGLDLPRTTVAALSAAVRNSLVVQRSLIDHINRDMRKVRHDRWRQLLPSLWRDRPGVVYHWLHASGAPWGSTPILDEVGQQCLSLDAVDGAVRRFWVDNVLRCHAFVDGPKHWSAFLSSRFGAHIPVMEWPAPPWTAE
jgi:exonuclease III